MFARIKLLLICLTVLSVAVVQVFGVRAGYFCGCTGQQSNVMQCEGGECHTVQNQIVEALPTEMCTDTDRPAGMPGENHHQHSELREHLVTSGFPPLAALPPAVLVDVLPGFEVPDFSMLVTSAAPVVERPDPPEYGSPPMPLLVAETIVMLI